MHDDPHPTEMSFLEAHLKYLMEDARLTPKLQLERAVGPLLTHFIARAMSGLTLTPENSDLAGHYRLICCEFPLKKSNNQSTNVDWLLLNETTGCLVFLELKTDVNSISSEQLKRYGPHLKKTLEFQKNILKISGASRHGLKYEHQRQKLMKLWEKLSELNSSKIVYLAPSSALIKDPQELPSPFHKISFADLPAKIEGGYSDEWSLIRRYLLSLDKPLRREVERSVVDNTSLYLRQTDGDSTAS